MILDPEPIVAHPSGDGRWGLFLPMDAPPVFEDTLLRNRGVERTWFPNGISHGWFYPILARWLAAREFNCARPFEIVRMNSGWGVFYLPPKTLPDDFFKACIQVIEDIEA